MSTQANNVSIPLEQGNVFRLHIDKEWGILSCLNPFGTGQCLSTEANLIKRAEEISLNPFGTGQCLST